MYRHGAPAQLAAIVDWEMGTVGDPKLDLGWMVQSWPEDTDDADDRRDELCRHARNAVARRGGRALRRGVRPSGRRPGLLPGAGQVEAGDRAGAGLPARGRRREAAGVRSRRHRPDGLGGRTRRVHRLPGADRCALRSARPTGRRRWSASRSTPYAGRRAGPGRGCGSAAAAVNFPDVLLVADEYQISVPPPFVPGSEFAGVIDEDRRRYRRFRGRRPGHRDRAVRRLRRAGRRWPPPAWRASPTASTRAPRPRSASAHRTAYHALRSMARVTGR